MTRSSEPCAYQRAPSLLRALFLLTLAALFLPAEAPAKKKKKPKKNEAVILGTVTNTEQVAIPLAQVRVTSESDPSFSDETVADKEGEFEIRIADPVGEYIFHLEAAGYASFSGQVPLQVGEQATIGFTLLDAAEGRRQEAVRAYNEGVKHFNGNDLAAAKVKFLEAAEKAPDMAEVHQGLAEIYYNEKNFAEAAAAVEKFLAEHPDDTNGLTLAYTVYRELGHRERTENLIDALSTTDKAKPLARQIYNEGIQAVQQGDNVGGLERFIRAAALDPELAQAYSSQATILYNLARYPETEEALAKLFELEPENSQGRRVRFLLYDALDDQAKAAEAMEAYLAVDPDGAVDLLYQRADMDFRDNNTERAITALEKILKLKPDFARAHYTLGLCYTSSDKAKAKVHLEKFIELDPNDSEVASAKDILAYLK